MPAKHLAANGIVDLLEGSPSATPRPSLAAGVPAIHVTEAAAELIVFKGQPNFVPIADHRAPVGDQQRDRRADRHARPTTTTC